MHFQRVIFGHDTPFCSFFSTEDMQIEDSKNK
jgi:hypothetical protein